MKNPQKQRMKELEKKLELVQLKISAFEKLIEVVERGERIAIVGFGIVVFCHLGLILLIGNWI